MMNRLMRWLRDFYLDHFVDPRYGGDPRYNAWVENMRRQAIESIPKLLASTEPEDEPRLQWISDHKAEFDWVDGGECCRLRCQSYKDEEIEGWGDDAWEATDSAMRDVIDQHT